MDNQKDKRLAFKWADIVLSWPTRCKARDKQACKYQTENEPARVNGCSILRHY